MKKPKIPDWWRCKNCRFYTKSQNKRIGGFCDNEKVRKEIIRMINTIPGVFTLIFITLTFRPGFGCIYFEPKEKNG